MAALTQHQKRALVCLVKLAEIDGPGVSRYTMGGCVYDRHSGLALKTILALQQAGYCEPVSPEAVELVKSGLCTCNCDRWNPTDKAKREVAGMNVKMGEYFQQKAAWKDSPKRKALEEREAGL